MHKIKDNAQFLGTLQNAEGKNVSIEDHEHADAITALINSLLIDVNGKLKVGLLPALAISETFPEVPDEAAMLALVAQRGDVAIRIDTEESFILAADDPTVATNWKKILAKAPGGAAADGHTHVISDVSGLTAKMTELATLKAAYETDLTEFLSIMNGGT